MKTILLPIFPSKSGTDCRCSSHYTGLSHGVEIEKALLKKTMIWMPIWKCCAHGRNAGCCFCWRTMPQKMLKSSSDHRSVAKGGKRIMWTPVYYVRLAPLPLSVDGVTLPNNDGSFDIYLNSRHPKQKQDETLTHELNHIQQDHFYNDIKGIRTIEQEADGVSSPEDPTVSQSGSSWPFHSACHSSAAGIISARPA